MLLPVQDWYIRIFTTSGVTFRRRRSRALWPYGNLVQMSYSPSVSVETRDQRPGLSNPALYHVGIFLCLSLSSDLLIGEVYVLCLTFWRQQTRMPYGFALGATMRRQVNTRAAAQFCYKVVERQRQWQIPTRCLSVAVFTWMLRMRNPLHRSCLNH